MWVASWPWTWFKCWQFEQSQNLTLQLLSPGLKRHQLWHTVCSRQLLMLPWGSRGRNYTEPWLCKPLLSEPAGMVVHLGISSNIQNKRQHGRVFCVWARFHENKHGVPDPLLPEVVQSWSLMASLCWAIWVGWKLYVTVSHLHHSENEWWEHVNSALTSSTVKRNQ